MNLDSNDKSLNEHKEIEHLEIVFGNPVSHKREETKATDR